MRIQDKIQSIQFVAESVVVNTLLPRIPCSQELSISHSKTRSATKHQWFVRFLNKHCNSELCDWGLKTKENQRMKTC